MTALKGIGDSIYTYSKIRIYGRGRIECGERVIPLNLHKIQSDSTFAFSTSLDGHSKTNTLRSQSAISYFSIVGYILQIAKTTNSKPWPPK